NNEIGVPLTLFQMNREHEVAVIEMGMRGMGEIDRLAEIAQPTVGVITNIGFAHIERLRSREKIAEAKSELLVRLPSDGVAILPRYDTAFEYLQSRVPKGCRILTYAEGTALPGSAFQIPEIYTEASSSPEKSTEAFTVRIEGKPIDVHLR